MKQNHYTISETHKVASNLRDIERMLGHSVPAGMLDTDALKDRYLTLGETATIASNLRSVERMRQAMDAPRPTKGFWGLVNKLLWGIVILLVLVSFVMIGCAVITALF